VEGRLGVPLFALSPCPSEVASLVCWGFFLCGDAAQGTRARRRDRRPRLSPAAALVAKEAGPALLFAREGEGEERLSLLWFSFASRTAAQGALAGAAVVWGRPAGLGRLSLQRVRALDGEREREGGNREVQVEELSPLTVSLPVSLLWSWLSRLSVRERERYVGGCCFFAKSKVCVSRRRRESDCKWRGCWETQQKENAAAPIHHTADDRTDQPRQPSSPPPPPDTPCFIVAHTHF
jgi:hypothetical protein